MKTETKKIYRRALERMLIQDVKNKPIAYVNSVIRFVQIVTSQLHSHCLEISVRSSVTKVRMLTRHCTKVFDGAALPGYSQWQARHWNMLQEDC